MTTQDPRTDQSPGTGVPAEQEPDEGSRFLLRNWRVRSRLVALILIPTLAALLLGGLRVITSVNTASEYQQTSDLARLVDKVAGLTHELQSERDRAAWNATIGRPAKATAAVKAQIILTNKASTAVRDLANEVRSKVSSRGSAEIEHILGRLDGVESLRSQALEGNLLPRAILDQYTLVIDTLLALQDDLAKSTQDDRLAASAVTLAALARAKESASVQRGMLTTVLPVDRFEQAQLQNFLGAVSAEESELRAFRKSATAEERTDFDNTVTGGKVDQAEFIRTLVLDRANAGFPLKGLDLSVRDDTRLWYDAMSQPINRMRTVEAKLTSTIVARSQSLKDDEQQRAVIVAVAVALLLIAVLLVTTGVARSLVRPLRRLRSEALEIAGSRLPDTVQKLREAGDAAEVPPIAPIQVVARDEIGEVARAFDEVHREAIRLAGDEARLRSNVNAMFVNLSRRTQTLVERQLSLIDGLEQGEQDEQRLGNLFKLDHLATRMRRNSENLLVLAGQEAARRWGQPVPIVDVVRASLSEVENYERVDLQVQSGASVVGQSVNDVVHLVAELVENAISFSPRDTKVTVSSNRIDGGGLIISVSDQGIGMTPEELAQTNYRLANPPVVDVSVSRRMGLFVVGRLALRHGIRVQLRQQDTGGLTAMVLLPEALLAHAGPAFPGVPGMPQPELTSPMPAVGTGPQFGASVFGGAPALASPTPFENPSRTPVFGADAPGVGTPGADPFERGPFESFPRETVGFDPDPFARNPFEPPPGRSADGDAFARNPFETGGSGRPGETDPFARNPFDTGGFGQGGQPDPFGRSPFESGPFDRAAFDKTPFEKTPSERDPFETTNFDSGPFDAGPFDTNPFNRGHVGEAPVDTPWPGHLPPPGGASWPGTPQDADPGWAGRTGRGAFEGDDNTGPLPVVRTSPLESEEEFLPIFAAVESDWFKKADVPADKNDADGETGTDTRAWSSPADVGWQAARAASEPALGGVTSSGLPKRVPKANLVPGSATAPATPSAEPAAAAASPPSPPPVLSPERVRSRLSSFQQGVRQGRAVARGEAEEDQGYPGAAALGMPDAQDTEKED
ncbi:nitrate- and nitrite sensing domain-containing protein [Microbispora sp. H10836]|uniref:nitrate- and nitrite sensing domain-containing protein n=1 Tax=Microbispora sp. H10836 TaxID=2729106 RepID=UPI002892BF40|nr:nitrate- and nitrite sensing domain-containing protein [Microbispora sp. H10836]